MEHIYNIQPRWSSDSKLKWHIYPKRYCRDTLPQVAFWSLTVKLTAGFTLTNMDHVSVVKRWQFLWLLHPGMIQPYAPYQRAD